MREEFRRLQREFGITFIHVTHSQEEARHARALVGGVLAGLFGDTRLFVSGGAQHQGPDGGGPVAVIAECAGS